MAKSFLVYGPTGAGKTTVALGMALWVYETTGRTTRIIHSDMGGVDVIEREGLVKAGIVSVYNAAGDSPKLLSIWRKLSRGYWPGVISEMREPVDGDGVATGPAKMVKVRKLISDQEAYNFQEFNKNRGNLNTVGFTYIEGATSTSEQLMRHLVKQEIVAEDGKVQQIGPEKASGRYEEDGEVIGGNSRGHYNIVQVEMHGLFSAFSCLPDPMLVGWSAHEGTGLLKRTGESCYAPQLAGGAKNHLVPSWVGDCFHLQDFPELRDSAGAVIREKEVRAYFVDHCDEDGSIPYKCKSRVGLTDLPALREQFPGGYVPLGIKKGEGLDQYFRWMDSRKGNNVEELIKWKEAIDARRKTS
jgi:hypothetical protein